MPVGSDVTVPAPVPARTTFRLKRWVENVAVTLVSLARVIVQVPVPVQPPPVQLAKLEPGPAIGVRMIAVPEG
jgi:hypothetical protein